MDQDTINTVKDELRARLEEDFVRLFNDGFRHHDLHAPDGIFMPHMRETIYWADVKERPAGNPSMRATQMECVDVVPTTPESGFTVTVLHLYDQKTEKTMKFKSLTVWKKYNGEWRMFRDMYNGMP